MAVRLDADVLARVEEYAKMLRVSRPEAAWTISDALREIIDLGLDAAEPARASKQIGVSASTFAIARAGMFLDAYQNLAREEEKGSPMSAEARAMLKDLRTALALFSENARQGGKAKK